VGLVGLGLIGGFDRLDLRAAGLEVAGLGAFASDGGSGSQPGPWQARWGTDQQPCCPAWPGWCWVPLDRLLSPAAS